MGTVSKSEKVISSIKESDIINGVYCNKTATEVADGCFNNLPTLRKVVLPKVKKIGSYCFINNHALTDIALPALTTAVSSCFRYNPALTDIALPALTTAGSSCFSYNPALTEIALPALTTAGSSCFSYNPALTEIALPALNKVLQVKDVDGYCFVVTNKRSGKDVKIYTGYNLREIRNKSIINDVCFVAEKEGFTAHGETIKQAVADVQFKIIAEKIKNDPINPDTIISVMYYRTITGACESGCKTWMRDNNITVNEMAAKDLLPILKKTNAYGVQRFVELVTF